MIPGIQAAASGMAAERTRFDVSANNTANVNTPGFRPSQAQLANLATGGVQVLSTTQSLQQGPLQRTNNPADLAIQGRGFFEYEDAAGNSSYSRVANITQDNQGFLRNAQGDFLRGNGARIQLPAGSTLAAVSADGTITAQDDAGNRNNVGTLSLALFTNEQGLSQTGGNAFQPTPASGGAMPQNPGQGGAGTIVSGAIELSSVDYVTEIVTQISAQRSFEANAATLRTGDEMAETLNKLAE